MKGKAASLALVPALFLAPAAPVRAHAVDEYLQAMLISVQKNRMDASLRLVPGVAVSPAVIAAIDVNGDGTISPAEGQAYARRVLGDITLRLDGKPLVARLVKADIPAPSELKDGLGEIRISFTVPLPKGGSRHRLGIQNHHQSRISEYLVNSLVSRDPQLLLLAQRRNKDQSVYELEYAEAVESQLSH